MRFIGERLLYNYCILKAYISEGVLQGSMKVLHGLLYIGIHFLMDASGHVLGVDLQFLPIVERIAVAHEGASPNFGNNRVICQLNDNISIRILHLGRLAIDIHGLLGIYSRTLWLEVENLSIFIQFNATIHDPDTTSVLRDITALAAIPVNIVVSTALDNAGAGLSVDDDVVVGIMLIGDILLAALIGVSDDAATIGSDQDGFAIGPANDLTRSVGQEGVTIVLDNPLVTRLDNVCC